MSKWLYWYIIYYAEVSSSTKKIRLIFVCCCSLYTLYIRYKSVSRFTYHVKMMVYKISVLRSSLYRENLRSSPPPLPLNIVGVESFLEFRESHRVLDKTE